MTAGNEFEGKRALVTGASRGIGRAVAIGLAGRGARVAVHYHQDRVAAEETLSRLAGEGHASLSADLADPAAARAMVEKGAEHLGGLDILVNNAGVYEHHPIDRLGFDEWLDAWNRTIGVNLLGAVHTTYAAVRHLIAAGGGKIVNVTSRGAFRGEPNAPAYGASKAGLNSFSQSLAVALAPHRIFVTAVAPGWVETDMAAPFLSGPEGEAIRNQSPLRRVARPEEIAETVLFLASSRSDFLTGAVVDANGASYLRT